MKKIEIILRKFLLKILLIISGKSANKDRPIIDAGTGILFIRLNKIGDALVTTPLLSAVKRKTRAKLYVLASKSNKMIFDANPEIENVFVFEKGFAGFRQLREIVKSYQIEILVDTHDDVSTTVSFLCAGSKAPFRFALKKSNEGVFTHSVARPDPKQTHIVDRILKIADLFDKEASESDFRISFPIKEAASEFTVKFFSDNVDSSKFVVGVNISAGSEARFWGVKNFSKMVRHLSELGLEIILLSTPSDSALAHEISQNLASVFDGDFHQLAAIINKLDLLISPDTSAVHLAAAYNTPVFGIYVHDTEDLIWSPYKTEFEWVETSSGNLKDIAYEDAIQKLDTYVINLRNDPKMI